MFEVPDAKRVKRSKLFSSGASSSSSLSSNDGHEDSGDERSSHRGAARALETGLAEISGAAQHEATSGSRALSTARKDTPIDYGFEYDFIEVVKGPSTATIDAGLGSGTGLKTEEKDADEDLSTSQAREQTFEFYLFKPTGQPNTQTGSSQLNVNDAVTGEISSAPNQITIRSPTPETAGTAGQGSILRPRPNSFYFTSFRPPSVREELRGQYENMAVSGPQVQTSSENTLWPGTYLPWRVVHLPTKTPGAPPPMTATEVESGGGSSTTVKNQNQGQRQRRQRPSKKRRILVRQRHAVRLSQQVAAKVAAQLAEEAEREKRTRRNREKKVKRKLKEKEKKLEKEKVKEKVDAGCNQVDHVDVNVDEMVVEVGDGFGAAKK